MGRTGIIGAMEEEIILLKEKMEIEVVVKKASMEFYQGTLNGKEVVLVKSGIGKVNAGLCAQILVDVFNVNRLINTGIAGSLKAEINIGDIVLSSDALQHDMDARAFGYARGEIPRMLSLIHISRAARRTAASATATSVRLRIWKGLIADEFPAAFFFSASIRLIRSAKESSGI